MGFKKPLPKQVNYGVTIDPSSNSSRLVKDLPSELYLTLHKKSLKQVDTYHSCYLITSPGREVRHVSFGIVRKLVDSSPQPYEKQPKSILNFRKLERKILRSLDYILQSTPGRKSISQLVGQKRHCPKSPDSQMIYSPVVYKLPFESLCSFTISRHSPLWRLDMIEPSHKEPHRTWKHCITVCRKG